jgi:NAD(P)-dependent dehydrogenase (short-subunit alcohol dehydrogenase family)
MKVPITRIVSYPTLHLRGGSRVSAAEIEALHAQGIPAGRVTQPDEIVSEVAFLADRRMGAMVGTTLQIDGEEVRTGV